MATARELKAAFYKIGNYITVQNKKTKKRYRLHISVADSATDEWKDDDAMVYASGQERIDWTPRTILAFRRGPTTCWYLIKNVKVVT
tara:strand:- start:53 stop:313 length:261 start_codon:yes stop_codon:yes gene_type:complete